MKLAAPRVLFWKWTKTSTCVLTVSSRTLGGLEHRKCIITQRTRFCNKFPNVFFWGKLLKQF